MPAPRTAAQCLVEQLEVQGVTRVFGVPGESYLAVLDALHGGKIDFVPCRQEGGAAMMADADARMTGGPGVCFVTRGPGATNASAGVHVAAQDSVPLILFVGQIARRMRHREAFQELDYRAVFGSFAKWVVEIDDPARMPELVARAFRTALQGRPGPVVVALPEDMLTEPVESPLAPRVTAAESAPAEADLARLGEMLEAAERPVMILGGSRWTPADREALTAFAEAQGLPAITTFRRTDLFAGTHPLYGGDLNLGPDPALTSALAEADLLLMIGSRMSESPSGGYTRLGIPTDPRRLIHIHPDPEEIGRVYQPDLGIVASPGGLLPALSTLPPTDRDRAGWARRLNDAARAWGETALPAPGPFHPGEMVAWLREALPDDAVITHGAGNFATWVHRHFRFRPGQRHIAPTSGSMGYGLPAAVAVSARAPERTVVCVTGDGDFLMTGQELATAMHLGARPIIVLLDNSIYGTIRAHQEREYPGRPSGTDLTNPDFAAYAAAFGAHAERVDRTEDFPAAFERARASGRAALLHCPIDPEAIRPGKTLSDIRAGR
ncbi:thiamine pyrophosphate-binding protein [Mesobaculum littorinae]|uniref:Thiamine pyrophosphate-binding protein n=1 Tax=Mesobaculum littorinae TaxID=2486419 RepID=A0A438AIS4_9RHOB|nr:thiamine pyrophosphate-binding protein [Mesobaculum littorinae]RVV98568.1 thiamine pyrophosphate-binding protein [Mesobaculum littorinae]